MKNPLEELITLKRGSVALVGISLALAAAGCGEATTHIDGCDDQETDVQATFDPSAPAYKQFSDPVLLAKRFEGEDKSKIEIPLFWDYGTSTHWGVGNIACKNTNDKKIVIKSKVIDRARKAFPPIASEADTK